VRAGRFGKEIQLFYISHQFVFLIASLIERPNFDALLGKLLMKSIEIPHYSVLSKLNDEIRQLAKKERKLSSKKYTKLREEKLNDLGFSSSRDFDEWVKIQKSQFDSIQSDSFRIKCLSNTPSSFDEMTYYYFESRVTLRPRFDEEDYHQWLFNMAPDLKPIPLMSIWVSHGEQLWDEVRRPSADVAAQRVYQRNKEDGKLTYVIRDFVSFSKWFLQWGGEALIEERLFTDEYIGTELLEKYEVVNQVVRDLHDRTV
jgi:hypothetical protein